jgi:hypothetical protein
MIYMVPVSSFGCRPQLDHRKLLTKERFSKAELRSP